MAEPNLLADTLTQVTQSLQRLGYETQFRQIERTFANRANEEIQAVIDADDTPKKLKELQKKRDKLAAEKPLIDEYSFQNQGNIAKLRTLATQADDAVAAFSADDGDAATLTASEASAIATKRDEILATLNAVAPIEHPNFNPDINIASLRKLRNELKSLTPSAGAVTDGSDNKRLLEIFEEISSRAPVAEETSSLTQGGVFNLKLSVQAALAGVEAESAELTAVKAEKTIKEIDEIKNRYAQLLQAISATFELNNDMVEKVAQQLAAQSPAPGSILNIFG